MLLSCHAARPTAVSRASCVACTSSRPRNVAPHRKGRDASRPMQRDATGFLSSTTLERQSRRLFGRFCTISRLGGACTRRCPMSYHGRLNQPSLRIQTERQYSSHLSTGSSSQLETPERLPHVSFARPGPASHDATDVDLLRGQRTQDVRAERDQDGTLYLRLAKRSADPARLRVRCDIRPQLIQKVRDSQQKHITNKLLARRKLASERKSPGVARTYDDCLRALDRRTFACQKVKRQVRQRRGSSPQDHLSGDDGGGGGASSSKLSHSSQGFSGIPPSPEYEGRAWFKMNEEQARLTRLLLDYKSFDAKELLLQIAESDSSSRTASCNICLRAAAREENYSIFDFVVSHIMARYNIEPDAGTWAALIEAAPSTALKRDAAFRAQVWFNRSPTLAAEILPYMIRHGLHPHFADGGSFAGFLDTLDTFYGEFWLCNPAVHQMLKVLGQEGLLGEAVSWLLELQMQHGYRPNRVDLTILLESCKAPRLADFAIWAVVFFVQQWSCRLDSLAMESLFTVLWNTRLYNSCRIVWVYACATGLTSFSMRHSVAYALGQSRPDLDTSRGARFRSTIGYVVTGIDPQTLDSSTVQAMRDRGTIQAVIDSQRDSICEPLQPFPAMLVNALALDKAWITARANGEDSQDLEWMRRNAMPLGEVLPASVMANFGASGRGERVELAEAVALQRSNRP